jgi:hypothetical protein
MYDLITAQPALGHLTALTAVATALLSRMPPSLLDMLAAPACAALMLRARDVECVRPTSLGPDCEIPRGLRLPVRLGGRPDKLGSLPVPDSDLDARLLDLKLSAGTISFWYAAGKQMGTAKDEWDLSHVSVQPRTADMHQSMQAGMLPQEHQTKTFVLASLT